MKSATVCNGNEDKNISWILNDVPSFTLSRVVQALPKQFQKGWTTRMVFECFEKVSCDKIKMDKRFMLIRSHTALEIVRNSSTYDEVKVNSPNHISNSWLIVKFGTFGAL